MTALWGHSGIEKCSSHGFVGRISCSLSSATSSSKGSFDFVGIEQMMKTIQEHRFKLQTGSSNQQYLTFTGVEMCLFEEIDKNRRLIGKDTRLTYDQDLNELIVKLMPCALHEVAHLVLAMDFNRKVGSMGLEDELVPVGGTRFKGSNKSKEGDSTFKPVSRLGENGWPTVVIESGLSESLSHLREDATFWLSESNGEVNILVLISIVSEGRVYHVEKWELIGQLPQLVQEILVELDSDTVSGGPLLLNFEKVFLRQPVGTEKDIIFHDSELLKWGRKVWSAGYRQ